MSRGRAAVLLALSAMQCAGGGRARADDRVEDGWQLYRDADFEGALSAFADAEAGDGLDAAELARLYEGRALVHFARGDEGAMEADLLRLSAIAPDHRLAADAPPEVQNAFVRARRQAGDGLRISLSARPAGSAVTVDAEVVGGTTDMVRELRVAAREADGAWAEASGPSLTLEGAGDAARVEAWAEAHGPGGAVVARAGSPDAPLSLEVGGRGDVGEREDGGPPRWVWWTAGGAGLAVATAVVVAVVVAGGGTRTRPMVPMVVE